MTLREIMLAGLEDLEFRLWELRVKIFQENAQDENALHEFTQIKNELAERALARKALEEE